MQVTLVLNYFTHSPECKINTIIKTCQLDEALMIVAQLKAKGYDITTSHYGIYKGDLHAGNTRIQPIDIKDQYELPVIKQTFKEELAAMWNRIFKVA